jgi:uncharacterized protein YukE
MPIEGMDVDQLQGLARQIDSDAQTLSRVMAAITGVAGQLVLLWRGAVADAFEQDWRSRSRPALQTAYNTLTDLHTHLVNNINQQTSASAADGGWTLDRITGDAGNVLTAVGLAGIALSAVQAVGKDAGLIAKHEPLEPDDPSLLAFLKGDQTVSDVVRSPGMKWLYDSSDVRTAGEVLTSGPVDKALKVVGVAGIAVGTVKTLDDAYHAADALDQDHYAAAANYFVDGVADGLKTVPNPVIYLAGVDVSLLHQVATLDWKDTPNPFSGSNFSQDYVPVLKSMGTGAFWEQAGKTLWGDM